MINLYIKKFRSVILIITSLVIYLIEGVSAAFLILPYGLMIFLWDFFHKDKSNPYIFFGKVFLPCSVLKILLVGVIFSFEWRGLLFTWTSFLLFSIVFFLFSKDKFIGFDK